MTCTMPLDPTDIDNVRLCGRTARVTYTVPGYKKPLPRCKRHDTAKVQRDAIAMGATRKEL